MDLFPPCINTLDYLETMVEKSTSIHSVSHYDEQDYLTPQDRRLLRKVDLRFIFFLGSHMDADLKVSSCIDYSQY